MRRLRAIPCLLLRHEGLVKTVRFRRSTYLGDPINIIRIFNDKEVDELILLDVAATQERRGPGLPLLERIVSECFMPVCYGGGISSVGEIRQLLALGIEKVSLNSNAVVHPELVRNASTEFGSQSIVVSIDVHKNVFGRYEVITRGGRRRTGLDPVVFARQMEDSGAGEILLTALDRDGTMHGYDLKLIEKVSRAVNIPVIACGGAATARDLGSAVRVGKASAAAAGSMFVFAGPHRAVLISYPSRDELERELRADNEGSSRSA